MTTFIHQVNQTPLPTVHVISDSTGMTAKTVVTAAAAQFGVRDPAVEILSQVKRWSDVEHFLEDHAKEHEATAGDNRLLVLYTLVDPRLSARMAEYAACHPQVRAIDLMTPLMEAFQEMSGLTEKQRPGALYDTDDAYFKRIEAQEFTIEHDDGRNPQDLVQADIVLVGVSRTSKTPLSIYLSTLGCKVANIPLDPLTEPPKELFDVDKKRLFGLMTTPEVLSGIRSARWAGSQDSVSRYSDYEYVCQDLESAKALMRKLGCIVVRTDKRAVEETAQEILKYYLRFHPKS